MRAPAVCPSCSRAPRRLLVRPSAQGSLQLSCSVLWTLLAQCGASPSLSMRGSPLCPLPAVCGELFVSPHTAGTPLARHPAHILSPSVSLPSSFFHAAKPLQHTSHAPLSSGPSPTQRSLAQCSLAPPVFCVPPAFLLLGSGSAAALGSTCPTCGYLALVQVDWLKSWWRHARFAVLPSTRQQPAPGLRSLQRSAAQRQRYQSWARSGVR